MINQIRCLFVLRKSLIVDSIKLSSISRLSPLFTSSTEDVDSLTIFFNISL